MAPEAHAVLLECKEDIETRGRSKTQKTEYANTTTTQAQAGTALPGTR